MIRTARLRIVARIAAAALLFAQAVIAFADCQMPARSPATAIASDSGHSPCHESGGEKNLCVAHCLSADQSLDKPQASVPQPATAPVLVVQPASELQYVNAPTPKQLVPPSAAPPPRILFRTLRI